MAYSDSVSNLEYLLPGDEGDAAGNIVMVVVVLVLAAAEEENEIL